MEPGRHETTRWSVYCKFDGTRIDDLTVGGQWDKEFSARTALNKHIDRVLAGKINGDTQIKHKIIEYFLLINN